MNPRKFALVSGILFLAVGLLALIPAMNQVPYSGLPALRLETGYSLFVGLFAFNILNKAALIIFGLWGIMAARAEFTSLPKSITYSRWVFAAMGLLSILGMFPQTNTLFGYWPLYGNEVWSHGIASLFGAYFSYRLTSMVKSPDGKVPDREALGSSSQQNSYQT